MVKIRRWVIGSRKKVVWSEPQMPSFIKINPDSPPGLDGGLQPGDLSMGVAAEEFLKLPDDEDEAEQDHQLLLLRFLRLRCCESACHQLEVVVVSVVEVGTGGATP